jgi:hypothetical protein
VVKVRFHLSFQWFDPLHLTRVVSFDEQLRFAATNTQNVKEFPVWIRTHVKNWVAGMAESRKPICRPVVPHRRKMRSWELKAVFYGGPAPIRPVYVADKFTQLLQFRQMIVTEGMLL